MYIGFVPQLEPLSELLSLVFHAEDAEATAKRLLSRFGDLRGALNASAVELLEVEGVDERVVELLRVVREIALRVSEARPAAPDVLNDPKEIEAYLSRRFGSAKDERLLVIFLDGSGVVLGEEMMGAGTVDQVVAFPRQVMAGALEHNASALLTAHNHPHGPPIPSARDREDAERLGEILRPFDLTLVDSIVVGRNRCFSIFQNGPL